MNRVRSFLKLGVILSALSISIISDAAATPFYRDIFNRCGPVGTDDAQASVVAGWTAYTTANTLGQPGFLKVHTSGSPNDLLAINSNPFGTTKGALFFPRPAVGLLLFSQEVSFDISVLTYVQYDQRLSGKDAIDLKNNGTRFAFLFGNTWYISDEIFRNLKLAEWETYGKDPHAMTYGTTTWDGVFGPDAPVNSGIPLPLSGTVDAFGVFLDAADDRVRLDNFTLYDAQVDERPVGFQGDISQCPSVTETPTPTETPIVTPTSTSTATVTTAPTSVVTPTSTATATPTATVVPTGTVVVQGTIAGCTDVPNVTTKGQIDSGAVKLASLTAEAARFLAKNSKRISNKSIITDAARAKAKADEYVKLVQSILIMVPEVSRTCTDAPVFCSSLDRTQALIQLDTLYTNLLNSAKRFTARAFFNSLGTTMPAKRNKNLRAARKAYNAGHAALLKLPKVETVCK